MVATARRKAERAKAFAEAQAKASKQRVKNTSKKPAKSANPPTSADADTEAATTTQQAATPAEQSPSKTPHRFILFIGNLPFSTTTAQIKHHFASVSPSSIRHSTDKTTGKSKGFAFLEFDDYSSMEVCLRRFHHSLFGGGADTAKEDADDGDGDREMGMKENPARAAKRKQGMMDKNAGPRRINVELTVGGGGSKSTARKDKLRAKNLKLGAERRKRAVDNAGKEGRNVKKMKTVDEVQQDRDEEEQIHPSRRAKVAR